MIEKPANAVLLSVAETYAKAVGQTLAQVSRKFYGKNAFFRELRRGKVSLTLSNYDKLMQKFSDVWPANAEWPEAPPIAVPRPAVSQKIPGKKISVGAAAGL